MGEVLALFRKQNPGKTFPEDPEDRGKDLSRVPNDVAEALLQKHYGKGWTTLEESIEENTKTLK